MKKIIVILLLTTTITLYGQSGIDEEFIKAENLLEDYRIREAYFLLDDLYIRSDKKDTLYPHVLLAYLYTVSELESSYRMHEQFDSSVIYGKKALELIRKSKPFLHKKELQKAEFWMHKNLVVSYFGLDDLENADIHKNILYKAYKAKKLPKNYYYIDQYFNFSFFKWKDKNIWGYEWYPSLPFDRFGSTFTKVVYYVYSTTADGEDDEQLFRFHVLMFHQNPKNAKFDYILEKQWEENGINVSGSYYNYRYQENIDYRKLKRDIIEILENDIQPNSRRTIEIR